MDDKTNLKKEKKSQKRIDRQARKNERRRLKSEALAFEETKMLLKPVKARLSKKSLPGFLAKNAKAIVQWLKDYSTLFVMADDYGFQRLDRLTEEKRNLLIQNYVDVNDFISILESLIAESATAETSTLGDETPPKVSERTEITDQTDQIEPAQMGHDL